MVVTGFCLSSGRARNSVESACNRCNPVHLMGSDEDEVGQAFDMPEKAANHHERPWLCEEYEELIQQVAAMPDPLPPWAKEVWMFSASRARRTRCLEVVQRFGSQG